jgi:hypothetical protein
MRFGEGYFGRVWKKRAEVVLHSRCKECFDNGVVNPEIRLADNATRFSFEIAAADEGGPNTAQDDRIACVNGKEGTSSFQEHDIPNRVAFDDRPLVGDFPNRTLTLDVDRTTQGLIFDRSSLPLVPLQMARGNEGCDDKRDGKTWKYQLEQEAGRATYHRRNKSILGVLQSSSSNLHIS